MSWLLSLGCGERGLEFAEPPPPPPPIDANALCNVEGATRCTGSELEACVDGLWVQQESCAPPTPQCDPSLGCQPCTPEATYCVGDDVWACGESGAASSLSEACAPEEECRAGLCLDACTLAEDTNSYLGCRFLAVPMANSLLDDAFSDDFAVVVANPSERADANVVVSRGGEFVAGQALGPGETAAITLPYVAGLMPSEQSVRVDSGAYSLRANVPIAAYQYNPLHFRSGDENSYTNDASLLLPEHVLTGNVLVHAWPGLGVGSFPGEATWLPGTLAVAATEDGTLVTVTSSAQTRGGDVAPLAPGGDVVISLDRGDVLQLQTADPGSSNSFDLCESRQGTPGTAGGSQSCLDTELGDLTGSVVTASAPVAVFAGHVCTYVPHTSRACDHLEEMMFPRETLGRLTVVAAPVRPGSTMAGASIVRVLSAVDGNRVEFTPDVLAPVVLDAGEVAEVMTAQDVLIEADGPIHVAQFLLSQQALGTASGDPAMGSAIPLLQWRSDYDFLVPDTYTSNWISLMAPAGTDVVLDDALVLGWVNVAGTGYDVARVALQPGIHRARSVGEVGFGIVSYGYAPFTSYLHPGGMNFLR